MNCQVNGVSVLGTQLQVSRSTGFLDPSECEKALKEVEYELARFLSGEDEGPILRQPGFTELVTKIRTNQIGIYQHPEKEDFRSGLLSEYLTLDCIITASSLNSAVQLRDTLEDIKTKVSEFGDVTSVFIPQPPMGIDALEVINKSHYGKVFVQFTKHETAITAKTALHGMIFDGRTVVATLISKTDFIQALGI